MKRMMWIVVGIGVVGGIGFYAGRQNTPPVPPVESANPSALSQAVEHAQPAKAALAEPRPSQPTGASTDTSVAAADSRPALMPDKEQAAIKPPVSAAFNVALECLVSSQTSYQQRQLAWQQLKTAGKLDQAITELEQRAASQPMAPEYPAALGQACLQKAGTIQDVREQGILGMKADQNFDAALNIDPSNWEARFWKACAMSYWPPQLNKGQEVVAHFVELVKQQEAQTPQPQFVQTYVLLGEQYQKAGHADYAKQIWQRGLGLFPNDSGLQQRLASVQ